MPKLAFLARHEPFTVTCCATATRPSGRLIGQRSDPPPTAAAQVQLAATLAQLRARQPITWLAASPCCCRAPAETRLHANTAWR